MRTTVCHDHGMPTLICDVDGVVWLARRAIPGAPEAIARLRAGGWRVLFVTNNSFSPAADTMSAESSAGCVGVA